MDSHIMNFIKTKMGYTDVKGTPYAIIESCDTWYCNNPVDGFHNRETVQGEPYELERTNMAKRCCEDDANLCEIVSIKIDDAGGEAEAKAGILNILKANRFDIVLREQLEYISAAGTAGAYVRYANAQKYDDGTLKDGKVEIVYCEGSNLIPLTVVNGEVTECAFSGVDIIDGESVYVLIAFYMPGGGDTYECREVIFNKQWKVQSDEISEMESTKPFAILKTAGVNNIKGMLGFGVPKVWNATAYLKGVDLAWNAFSRDLEKADKLVFMNETLFDFDKNGVPIKKKRGKLAKQLFCFLGKKLPDQKEVIQEYNPEVRVKEATESMELCLSMLSMMFGYGTRKYTFENGQIQTATQYIGERQDAMQELNKQRESINAYITDIIKAVTWMSNTFNGTTYSIDSDITVDYDDSYITDRNSELEQMRNDTQILGVPMLTVKYLMKKYDIDETTARQWYEGSLETDNEKIPPEETVKEDDIAKAAESAAGKTLNGAQTASLINVIQQYQAGTLTISQAVNIISVSIGVTKEAAQELIGEVS